ncbi:MAG: division/cell wall cluster transcriptional repressor MraZ [Pseudomonadales bacterium]|nr:division/cell wall cluster transcriptional repressor MraZ [Pseudomonadales bacterium]
MFTGSTALVVDDKGRLAVPTRQRAPLLDACEGKLVITVDTHEKCLRVYPAEEWQAVAAQLVKLSDFKSATRNLKRLLLGNAEEVEMDRNGRILVSAYLRNFAGIKKNAVLVGMVNRFDLWDGDHLQSRSGDWTAEGSQGGFDDCDDLSELEL